MEGNVGIFRSYGSFTAGRMIPWDRDRKNENLASFLNLGLLVNVEGLVWRSRFHLPQMSQKIKFTAEC